VFCAVFLFNYLAMYYFGKRILAKSCLNIFGEIDCSTSRAAGVICSNGTISTTTIKSTTTG
jgi:hypothetical protein